MKRILFEVLFNANADPLLLVTRNQQSRDEPLLSLLLLRFVDRYYRSSNTYFFDVVGSVHHCGNF